MKLSALGEFEFIRRFSPQFAVGLPDGIIGIGDDCAVIPQATDQSLIITTDALVEDVHFLRSKISPADLGYKTLAVNLSDIAAMGGSPHSVFLTLALPPDIEVAWLDQFFNGFASLAREHGVLLLGGDTTRSPEKIMISLTALGYASPEKIKYRSGSREGDIVCVTGMLGDSAGGLKAVLENIPSTEDSEQLKTRHYRPEPQIQKGQYLAKQPTVHSMMDLSDGIDSDIRRLMTASNCGAKIYLDNLPLSEPLLRTCKALNWEPQELAVAGGEDYCLALTVAKDKVGELKRLYLKEFNTELYAIGEITSSVGQLSYTSQGSEVQLKAIPFQHFLSK